MNPHELPDPATFNHRCPIQLRFNDIDILGHVNNTVYFSFYDTGKAHYFNSVRQGDMNWQHVDTVIANVNCAYVNSIIFGEDIEVLTRCERISEKSFVLLQMLAETGTGQVKSVCETVMVSYDPETHSSTSLPAEWRRQLELFEGRELSVKR